MKQTKLSGSKNQLEFCWEEWWVIGKTQLVVLLGPIQSWPRKRLPFKLKNAVLLAILTNLNNRDVLDKSNVHFERNSKSFKGSTHLGGNMTLLVQVNCISQWLR